ncbi:MAG TPA: AI-2E family transporter [Gaiella sp.]|jgi:predicted PurR-regulated permease PerM
MAAPAAHRDSLVDRAMPIYVGLLFAVFTIVAFLALYMLRHVLLILFVSILFAAALTGPTDWLHARLRLPRGLAAVLIYVAVFAVLVGLGWLVVPPLLGQVAEFADRAPEYADRYQGIREAYTNLRSDFSALPPFDEQMSRLGNAILDRAGDRATALPADLFGLFLDMLSVFVISLLLVTSRTRIQGFVLSLVQPGRRADVASILDRIWSRIGVYLRAKAIVMTIVGVLMYIALIVIGVPFAVPLAIVVAFGELIPRAGPWLARLPLLAIAALDSPRAFILTLIASVLIENLKGYVLSPVVEGDQLDIHPLVVFVAVLVGASLGGPAGAFVAVPAAAIVDIVVREVVVPWRQAQLSGRTTDGTARIGSTEPRVRAGPGATRS